MLLELAKANADDALIFAEVLLRHIWSLGLRIQREYLGYYARPVAVYIKGHIKGYM